VLPPPIGELVPFVVPNALLDAALLDDFAGLFLEGISICNGSLPPNRLRICIPNPPPLFLYLS
jgi:hypothetical protein